MDESLYDEFGNYIGPEVSDDEDIESNEEEEQDSIENASDEGPSKPQQELMEIDEEDNAFNQVVLHEDKKYYPSAEEVYGKETETLVMEEDAQPLEVPIIAPIVAKKFESQSKAPLKTTWTNDFMAVLMSNPELVRNVAVVGHLHHGKTTLMDMLIETTHDVQQELPKTDHQMRFTDTRFDEQARRISIKMMPMSLVMQNSSGKSYVLNLLDTPGHVNFNDEVTAALRLADGLLLVVDALEGVMVVTERVIQQALAEDLPVCLFVSKMDRLITELKIPPADAYHKIRHTLEEVNGLLIKLGVPQERLLDPMKGNVAFGSCISGWCFTLESFAKLFCDIRSLPMDHRELAKRLWGDYYYYSDIRKFRRKPSQEYTKRTFVEFVLEPLYKVYSYILGEHPKSMEAVLNEFGVHLRPGAYNMDIKPLLKEAMTSIFGSPTGLVDMLVRNIPSSKKATEKKVLRHYTGNLESSLARNMRNCDRNGPLVVHVAKLFPRQDCSQFDAFGRIFSGTIRMGDKVHVLGESYTPEDEEDSIRGEVGQIWVFQSRYRVPFTKFSAGNLILIEGLDATIMKTATIVTEHIQEEMHIFRPLKFHTVSVVKIATEPLKPAELPKMVEGLRKINKSYPLATTKVEESGEHTILGTGEIYLDSLMKDLRELYADIEVKVADPVVSFNETVVETSSLKCFAETPNKRNKITMIAEPLDKGLAEDIESGNVEIAWSKDRMSTFFRDKYDWDALAARSVWAFGADKQGPNVLLDDTLPSEVDKGLLEAARESIVQGFQWGARDGPLCEEPVRNVKFKIIDAQIATEPLARGGGQIIPTARRCMYSAFLMATPRLMEPVYYVEIQTPADCMSAIYNVLGKRRGHVTADVPKPGTPIFLVKAHLPVIESFGFETDLRYHTQGQAFCLSVFDHWSIVPGDPLDRQFVLRPLEPAPVPALAREFLVKTRRRKGMNDDVSITKYFDDPMLLELAKQDLDVTHIFLLPIFELLETSTNVGAKEEALRILAHISTDKECRSAIRQTGGIGLLVEFLKPGSVPNDVLIGRAVRTIRNLANDSAATRKTLRQVGATELLIQWIAKGEENAIAMDAVAAIGYLSHRDRVTKAVLRRMGGIPLLVRMLHADPKQSITCYAAGALHNLIDGSTRNKIALRAAGAIPRVVQLLDGDPLSPIVEVSVRILQKLSEKFEDAQADIRRNGGIGKLVELQTKTKHGSLLDWIELTLQTLKLSEKEMGDSKMLLTLGSIFQKEFDKLRFGSDQILEWISEMRETLKLMIVERDKTNEDLATENDQLRGEIEEKKQVLDEIQDELEERNCACEDLKRSLLDKDDLIERLEATVEDKQKTLQNYEGDRSNVIEDVHVIVDQVSDRDNQIAKLKETLQERSSELKKLNLSFSEKDRQISHLEAMIGEKDRYIAESLDSVRDQSNNHKQERNHAILDLVNTLKDVIATSPPDSPKVQDVNESIHSFLNRPPKPPIESSSRQARRSTMTPRSSPEDATKTTSTRLGRKQSIQTTFRRG